MSTKKHAVELVLCFVEMQSGYVMHACDCLFLRVLTASCIVLHSYVARHRDEIMSENKWIAKLWTACWF
jgi:hypothetical protein